MSTSARVNDAIGQAFRNIDAGAQWFGQGNGEGRKGTKEPAWFQSIREAVRYLASELDPMHDISGHLEAMLDSGERCHEFERWFAE